MTDRFTEFLASLQKDTYPEPPSPIHEEITGKAIADLRFAIADFKGLRVLDVGCGQGVALRRFKELGCEVTGITTNETDLKACRDQGFHVGDRDMHEISVTHEGGWDKDSLDLIWARHVLEHSPAPLFALREFHRVLKADGWLYFECPMPNTSCRHETNQNHYSVLTCSMWQALIGKAGFTLVEGKVIPLNTQAGPDEYRSYLCRKVGQND